MYHGSPNMTQDINIFKYWKKIKLFRKMFEKFSMSSFQASFDPFWPIFFSSQNTPKHAYFQKLEENKTLMKNIFFGFFAHFVPFFAQNLAEKAIFQKSEDVTL